MIWLIGPSAGFPRGTRTFSIVRCVRLFRVHRLWTTELLTTSNLFLRIIRILASLYLTCHLTACIFWAAGSLQAEDNRWTGRRWPVTFNVASAPETTQYLNSLYFTVVTLLTIGYGDIVPKTSIEKFCAMIIIGLGAMFSTVVLSTLTLMLQNMG